MKISKWPQKRIRPISSWWKITIEAIIVERWWSFIMLITNSKSSPINRRLLIIAQPTISIELQQVLQQFIWIIVIIIRFIRGYFNFWSIIIIWYKYIFNASPIHKKWTENRSINHNRMKWLIKRRTKRKRPSIAILATLLCHNEL